MSTTRTTTTTLSKPHILFELTKEEMMDLFDYEKDTRTGNIQIDYQSTSKSLLISRSI